MFHSAGANMRTGSVPLAREAGDHGEQRHLSGRHLRASERNCVCSSELSECLSLGTPKRGSPAGCVEVGRRFWYALCG